MPGVVAVFQDELDILVGGERDPFRRSAVQDLLADRRIARRERIRRNGGTLAHNAAGRNKRSGAYARAAEQNRAHSDQAFPADEGTVENGAVAYGDPLFQDEARARRIGVSHDVVLNAAAGSDPDRREIGPQHGTKPDARIFANIDIADQHRIGRNERTGGNTRRASFEFDNDWHDRYQFSLAPGK